MPLYSKSADAEYKESHSISHFLSTRYTLTAAHAVAAVVVVVADVAAVSH